MLNWFLLLYFFLFPVYSRSIVESGIQTEGSMCMRQGISVEEKKQYHVHKHTVQNRVGNIVQLAVMFD